MLNNLLIECSKGRVQIFSIKGGPSEHFYTFYLSQFPFLIPVLQRCQLLLPKMSKCEFYNKQSKLNTRQIFVFFPELCNILIVSSNGSKPQE